MDEWTVAFWFKRDYPKRNINEVATMFSFATDTHGNELFVALFNNDGGDEFQIGCISNDYDSYGFLSGNYNSLITPNYVEVLLSTKSASFQSFENNKFSNIEKIKTETTENWIHIAFSYKHDSKLVLYINGFQKGESTHPGTIQRNGILIFGQVLIDIPS